MTNSIEFAAQPRTITGKKVYTLRQAGQVPGHVFGGKKGSVNITVDAVAFEKLYESAGESSLISLKIEGEKKARPVLIDEVQVDAVTDQAITVSFREVNLNVEIEADITLEIVGEVDIPNSVVNQVVESIPVKALPADLPESFELDVSTLTEVGQSLAISDLEFDRSKVTIMLDEDQMTEPLVTIAEVSEEPEPEEETDEEVELEAGEDAAESTAEGEASDEEAKE